MSCNCFRLVKLSSVPVLIGALMLLGDCVPADAASKSIDLRSAGYPSPPCDYMFQDADGLPKRHVEFLDSQHLVVSFTVPKAGTCQGAGVPWPTDFRSVVLDLSGKIVSKSDWSRPAIFNVKAGPDGKLLEIVPGGIRVMDQSFQPLQEIALPEKDFPKAMVPSPLSIQLAPSRHGFAATFPEFIGIGFNGYSAYFDGDLPLQQTLSQNTDDVIVGDGLLLAMPGPRGVTATPRSIELDSKTYSCAKAYWIAIPIKDHPVCLTSDFQLAEMVPDGNQTVIADFRDMAPGWNSVLGYLLCDANSHRILLYSYGRRFPVTDAWGFGNYFKIAVLDLNSKQVVFQQSSSENSDVALSPDGKLLAVREKARLTLSTIP
jgi:hypothetical protein